MKQSKIRHFNKENNEMNKKIINDETESLLEKNDETENLVEMEVNLDTVTEK